ncbi:MAG TPA: CHAD domain-containing protein [Baekduia sp.]|uniref:CHAD domain-containing protein n=1 Tax=Baekduia sp. TaxID=2600305 RepID=UPI002D7907A9|nr:CHAD domain-containing protein [Baekduia sp.]HET6506820.1 CHAD domain-containing protein [Baekduia sp.]
MKARKVKGIDPDGAAADQVAKIVAVRLDELGSFMPKARDPLAVHTLHDMRIAAKRLRYVLELFGDQLGPYAVEAAKQAKKLQDVLGEIHDCDVTRPRIAALARELRAADARAVRALADPDAKDLDPALVADAPHRAAYRGLTTMDVALSARRELLFDRFLARWEKLERDGFRDRLLEAITSRSHGGNGAPPDHAITSEASTP